MAAIRKFFQKKKADAKFKLAGPGHRLDEEAPTPSSSETSQRSSISQRSAQSEESRQAAAAALARIHQKPEHAAFNTSLASIQARVRREMEAEKKAKALESPNASRKLEPVDLEASPVLAVRGVYFRCPMIGPEVHTKEEWESKIKEFLYQQLEEEMGLTACLIIHSCNKSREKVQACVETLCKYLENIMLNPTEEKFRKIRMSNRVFQDKVAPLEGTFEFLKAAGFETCKLPYQDAEEDFLVFSEDKLEYLDFLQVLCDSLRCAEPVGLELDRDLQVLLPNQARKRMELPPVFFRLTVEDFKREQQLRAEGIEKNLMLRTKAMREKDEQRELRRYRFALIRIRFPDGLILQGTFRVYEKLSAVIEFVKENLVSEWLPFVLNTPTGSRLEENDKTLLDLHLAPATILNFTCDKEMMADVKGQTGEDFSFLKPEVMNLVQSL